MKSRLQRYQSVERTLRDLLVKQLASIRREGGGKRPALEMNFVMEPENKRGSWTISDSKNKNSREYRFATSLESSPYDTMNYAWPWSIDFPKRLLAWCWVPLRATRTLRIAAQTRGLLTAKINSGLKPRFTRRHRVNCTLESAIGSCSRGLTFLFITTIRIIRQMNEKTFCVLKI